MLSEQESTAEDDHVSECGQHCDTDSEDIALPTNRNRIRTDVNPPLPQEYASSSKESSWSSEYIRQYSGKDGAARY